MKETHYIGIHVTPSVENLTKVKEALVDKGFVEPLTPNEKLSEDLEKNLESVVPENIKLGVKIGKVEGTYEGEGIQFDIPAPSDIKVSDGILVYTAPDLTEYAEFNPTVSYIITVNGGTPITTSATTYNIKNYLREGENYVEVSEEEYQEWILQRDNQSPEEKEE